MMCEYDEIEVVLVFGTVTATTWIGSGHAENPAAKRMAGTW
jgi:hypothetical protein